MPFPCMENALPYRQISGWLPVLLGFATASSQAGSGVGESTDYVAAGLMSLGLLAIFLGVRSLRGLRHKQPPPRHRRSTTASGHDPKSPHRQDGKT